MLLILLVFYFPCFTENAVRNVNYVSEVKVDLFTRKHFFAILGTVKWSAISKHYDNHVSSYLLLISSGNIEFPLQDVKNATKQ